MFCIWAKVKRFFFPGMKINQTGHKNQVNLRVGLEKFNLARNYFYREADFSWLQLSPDSRISELVSGGNLTR